MGKNARLTRVLRVMLVVVGLLVVIALVGGVAAALFGGSLSELGEGYGGLWGWPATILPLIALVLGVTAAIKISRDLGPGSGRLRIALLVVVGVWVVAIGYSEVAHIADPCVRGWWDEQSKLGSQPLCERFEAELNWNTRFHLLAHAVPAALLLGLYLWAVHRWARPCIADKPDPSESPAEVRHGADITG